MNNKVGPDEKIRMRNPGSVHHHTNDSPRIASKCLSDENRDVREESRQEGRCEVLEIGECETAIGDDVVAESSDVVCGVSRHVQVVDRTVAWSEESELRCGGGGGGGEELEFDFGGGDGVGEESVAMAVERS